MVIRSPVWCISKIPILKWLQLSFLIVNSNEAGISQFCVSMFFIIATIRSYLLVCSLVVVIFISDGKYQWFFYTVVFHICVFLIVLTFMTLVTLFVGIKNVYNVEVIFNLIAFLLCLLADSVLTYDLIQMVSGSFGHHRYLPPIYIGRESWKNRIAVCTVFLLLGTLFYQASFVLTKRKGRSLEQ